MYNLFMGNDYYPLGGVFDLSKISEDYSKNLLPACSQSITVYIQQDQ